jgi:hypothetical protein
MEHIFAQVRVQLSSENGMLTMVTSLNSTPTMTGAIFASTSEV